MLPPLAFLEINMPRAKAYHAHQRYGILAHSRAARVRRDGDNSSEYYAQDSTYSAFGAIKVRVAIDPTAVPAMAGVAVPPLRYALIFGLTLLISILILAALILGKRQSELAAAREDFVSGVSHELRTPLAQIRMFAETLLLGRVRNEVERRRALEVIDQEARRLTALVENVLNLSRSRRGTARLAPAATELAPSVREILDTFSQMPRSRSVDFRLELEDRLVATVDPGAFRQILLNLLDNAVKYGPVGQRVSIGLAMFEKQARLWVDDEGPGIPERERERVFEPFYRATGQDTSVAGSGIGLAVVRELAVLLAGRAWVDDAPGGGARLVVEFPDAYLRAEDAAASWAVA
jgi:signal transduction histidine kinase